jgi:hypothetical protein
MTRVKFLSKVINMSKQVQLVEIVKEEEVIKVIVEEIIVKKRIYEYKSIYDDKEYEIPEYIFDDCIYYPPQK